VFGIEITVLTVFGQIIVNVTLAQFLILFRIPDFPKVLFIDIAHLDRIGVSENGARDNIAIGTNIS
jgi:hypothetical protein